MTPRIVTEALQVLAARGNIAPDRAINMDTLEAANAAPTLAAEVLELRAMRDAVSPAVGTMYQSAKARFDEHELIIDHLGDLLAHQMAETAHWRQVAFDGLTQNTALKRELAAARAEIERQREYIAGRVYDC